MSNSTVAILDLANRMGRGISSLGIGRIWVLIEGETAGHGDNRIIELKELRPNSALSVSRDQQGRHTLAGFAKGHRDRDVFLGIMPCTEKIFLVREIFPWADRLEITRIPENKTDNVARCFGKILADFHLDARTNAAMADWVDANAGKLCDLIFKYGKQVKADWKRFRDSN